MITISFETGETLDINENTLRGSVLSGYDFHRAIFDGLDLESADFRSSKLRGTSLRNINACFADFSGVPLMTSDFFGANLMGSKFVNSETMYTDFSNANLYKSDMTNANITGAIFKGAHLEGALLLCQQLDKARLNGAFYDVSTVWPEGFDPTSKGAILISA
ncbi:MAG: pentapeptide repeat-containing protein [Thiomargarita sp.]|nr:pentapeptide repeat-containing protein [Thiomargarita sp.]